MTAPSRTRGVNLLALVLAGVLLSAGPANALISAETKRAGSPLITAVPGSRAGTYATPVLVAEPGDDITFVNTDLFAHSVRSVRMGPDDASWCNPWDAEQPAHPKRNPRQFPIGKCPLLWTLPIAMTVGVVQTKVYGTENLKSGTEIEFYCTVFPTMRGTLIVN